jgi:predicted nucleic acid-binding protein
MVYLDTSFIAPLAIAEASSESVEAFLLRRKAELATSQWTRVELASLVARRVRMGELDADQAEAIRTAFDRLLAESFTMLTVATTDFTTAVALLAKPDTGLRAGDALHLAIARNHRAKTVYTLDRGLLKAGKRLKLPVSAGIAV